MMTVGPAPPPVPEMNPLRDFTLVVLFTAVVVFVPAELINLAVGRWGSRQALSWWRLALFVLLGTAVCWFVYVAVWIVGLTIEAS
jgi:hypothetical protein